MLTAFPLQTLGDAPAMVAFSHFPASLATAAEVYVNLETAVRAAPEADRDAIFDKYNKQMERLDEATKRQLEALQAAEASGRLLMFDVKGPDEEKQPSRLQTPRAYIRRDSVSAPLIVK